jgi:hypothetical protein
MGVSAPVATIRHGRLDYRYRSGDLGEQGAGVADVARGLAAFNRGEDRLQERAGIVVGADGRLVPGPLHPSSVRCDRAPDIVA